MHMPQFCLPLTQVLVFVVTAHLLKSTATKQKKSLEDAVTDKSKDDVGNKASLAPTLKLPKKKQNKTTTTAKEA